MTKALIIMTRIPEEGKTKTRLMPRLTAKECVDLHVSFLKDLSVITSELDAHVYLYYTPEKETTLLDTLFPHAKGMLLQAGDSLGERMHHGLEVLLKDYESVLLIGSDLPELTTKHLEEGFRALEHSGGVLGPSLDGGYYLVGLKEPCPQLFKDKVYSTPTVLEEALETLRESNLNVTLLKPLNDVDLYEDLVALRPRLKDSFTKKTLEEILD